ncbi:unnamed protein product [Adineta steineri]|uniref:Phosphatidic acid phosphatase type 2/haloperoxidase domain-containing protein n=1 Tax=Adineta steineri TaxID=433720 RepID=A0A814TNN2_9BILA|nr:unnamed protein product [Adineta steineri]CAF3910518.1 unnamed protein product [Adineta steineri]
MDRIIDTIIPMQQSDNNDCLNKRDRFQLIKTALRIYLRTFWMDYLSMSILGGLTLAIHSRQSAPTRIFAVYSRTGKIVNPEISYPFHRNLIPSWLAGLLAFIIPFIFIMLMQIRVKSFDDVNAATMGLFYSLLTSTTFQVFMKWLIGGLRPHFFSVCKLNINRTSFSAGQGFDGLMFDRSICTGDKMDIDGALKSMPSGHSTIIFAGLVYCSLYLNGKLKIFSNYRSQYWKFVLFFVPILIAVLIAASLMIDHYHHWYDILVGSTIGTMFAFGSYRFQYTDIWNYRLNHIPLPRLETDHLDNSTSTSKRGGWDQRHIRGVSFHTTRTLSPSSTYF